MSGSAARAAATIALAGAATATLFDGTGHAAPSPAQLRAQVKSLYRDAEIATEKYNGAKEKADRAETHLKDLRDEAARRTGRLNEARAELGEAAKAQYREGTIAPSLQVALTSAPDQYLEKAALAERAGTRQARAIEGVRRQIAEIAGLRAAADGELTRFKARQDELRRQKKTITHKLAAAKRLLSRLTAEERARVGTSDSPGASASRGSSRLPAPTGAPTSRAAAAVAYAYGALGRPYVWGASGPHAYDCSGLIQAAYRAAGIALPRTTYAQINAGRRVSRGQLLPGDLVFFYSGVSHVGIYVGGGRMIHAPNPSSSVRLDPVDRMPFAGATRVA